MAFAFTDTGRVLLAARTPAWRSSMAGASDFGAEDGIEVGNVTALAERGRGIWLGGEHGLQHFDGERFAASGARPGALAGISGIIERATATWLNGLGWIVHIRRPDLERALSSRAS